MVDCSVLDEVRSDPSFRRFVSEANSGQSCRHCFDSGKWPVERAWSVLFNAQIEASVQGRLESVWESTTMLLAGCPKSLPELMAEVYLTRAEVALRCGSLEGTEVQMSEFNRVALALPDSTMSFSSLAAALRTRVLLPMETTNNPDKVKEWLDHVVFDGGDANVDAADICRIISRLERRRVTSHDAASSSPFNSSRQPVAQRFKVKVSDGARGRHWVATEDISPGQLVWVEHRPLVGYDNSGGRHCYTCLRPTAAVRRRSRPHPLMDVDESLQLSSLLCQRVVPCPCCSVVLFCSPYCFGSGAKAHLLECTNRHFLHTADAGYQGHMVGLVIKILADLIDNQHCDGAATKMKMTCLTGTSDILGLEVPAAASGFDSDMASGAAWWAALLEELVDVPKMGPLALRLILTASNNAHGLGDSDQLSPWGYGLYPNAVFINHSCLPNVDKVFGDDGRMVLYARRAIVEGQEICDCYGRLTAFAVPETPLRVATLQKHFGFACTCRACSSSSAGVIRTATTTERLEAVQAMRMIEERSGCDVEEVVKISELMIDDTSMSPLLDKLLKSVMVGISTT